MQRSICFVSTAFLVIAGLSGTPAYAGPSSGSVGFAKPSMGFRPHAPITGHHKSRPLLPPIHERKRELPLLLGAGSAPLFYPAYPVDHHQKVFSQPESATSVFPGNISGGFAPQPVFEAPRPYAPPSFTILGKSSRKHMGAPVRLTRGGDVEAAAVDPRVIFLNDDGSQTAAASKPGRRK